MGFSHRLGMRPPWPSSVRAARRGAQLDMGMVALFSIIAGLAALAGICSLGFGLGTYHFLSAFAP